MMRDVVVVEDQSMLDGAFHEAFPGNVDIFRHASALKSALDRGCRWQLAFVDFDLKTTSTGLTVLRDLSALSPETRTIAFTAPDEHGRALYLLAGRHWFSVWGLLDKNRADMMTLRACLNGLDPTPRQWKSWLLKHAPAVDSLFQEPTWLAMWRQWPEFAGSRAAAMRHLDPRVFTESTIKKFQSEAHKAMVPLSTALSLGGLLTPTAAAERKHKALGTELSVFAHTNRLFFRAPDLDGILDQVRPWAVHKK